MKPQDQRFLREWEERRTTGKWRYILTIGLIWGFISAVLSRIFNALVINEGRTGAVADMFFSADFLFYLAVFMLIGGPVFGFIVRTMSERRYARLKKGIGGSQPQQSL